jgi:RHS repeat-associated protein
VVKELEWDSFGNLVSDSNPGFELAIGFAGGLRDALTGLVRFGVRDYEPASGRWTSRDAALFDTRQTNLFAYVGNDLINKFDPVGLWSAGGSAYEGIGGGFRFGMTNEGFSLCAEIGIGGGDSFDYSPSGGLDENGVSVEASVALKAGALGNLEASAAIDDCGKLKQKRKACVGPLCTEFEKNKDQWERNGKLEIDPTGTENLLDGFKKGGSSGICVGGSEGLRM